MDTTVATLSYCGVICCALIIYGLCFSCALVMIIYGSVCVHTNDYANCGELTGAICLIVFGVFIIICCCFGGITLKIKKSQESPF